MLDRLALRELRATFVFVGDEPSGVLKHIFLLLTNWLPKKINSRPMDSVACEFRGFRKTHYTNPFVPKKWFHIMSIHAVAISALKSRCLSRCVSGSMSGVNLFYLPLIR